MRFWWVNHKQTYKHEIEGGYLWSPKTKKGGARNQSYDNMRHVMPGDIVFSYAFGQIRDVGIVTRVAASCPKPNEFGSADDAWAQDGWMVPLEWSKTPAPFRPKTIIDVLRDLLPSKFSPISPVTGDGQQHVYLAEISEEVADALLLHWGGWGPSIIQAAAETGDDDGAVLAVDQAIENIIRADDSISETEQLALVKARRGQGKYRQNLLNVEMCCRVSGLADQRLLRASHIKPWRSCMTSSERLDGNNGLLLSPNIDLLFDRGYISFNDDGAILISPLINQADLARLGVNPTVLGNVGPFSAEQGVYLAFHRKEIFHAEV